jgi:hypothetical protein
MAQEVERAKPEFIVYVNAFTSWLRSPASEGWIFGWLQQFLEKNYEIVGVAEIFDRQATQYRWGVQAVSSPIRSPSSLVIFRRLQQN